MADRVADAPDQREFVHLPAQCVVRLFQGGSQGSKAPLDFVRHKVHIRSPSICVFRFRSSSTTSLKLLSLNLRAARISGATATAFCVSASFAQASAAWTHATIGCERCSGASEW